MTEKLKCPFCNAELRTNMLDQPVMWYCPNHCIGSYEPKVWQALIAGKKAQVALKVAIDALSKIDTFDCHGKGAMEIIARMASIANGALYEITSITKQDK